MKQNFSDITNNIGIKLERVSEVVIRLSPGTLRSTTHNQLTGGIPIISQSETGVVGYHDGAAGIEASSKNPIVTFANHTCAVRWHEAPFSTIQNVFPLRGKPDLLDTSYLYWFLKSAIVPSFYGGHWPVLVDKLIPIPDIKYQRRIAAHLKAQLAAVEEARNAAQTQLEDSLKLIPAILKAAFTQITHTETVKIGNVARTTSGTTPSRECREYWQPAEYPWVKTGEIAFEPIKSTAEKVSAKALKECSLSLLPIGTVLVAMYGQGKTRGQSAVLATEATTNQACFAILPNSTFDPEYLQLWLRHSYEDLRGISDARGGNQSNLNGNMLNQFEVPLLSREKQQHIVKQIKAAITEAQILQNTLHQQRAEINLLPSKILAKAFEYGAKQP